MYPYIAALVFVISAGRKGPGEPAQTLTICTNCYNRDPEASLLFCMCVNMTTLAHIDVYELEADMINLDIRIRSRTCDLYEFVGVQTYASERPDIYVGIMHNGPRYVISLMGQTDGTKTLNY